MNREKRAKLAEMFPFSGPTITWHTKGMSQKQKDALQVIGEQLSILGVSFDTGTVVGSGDMDWEWDWSLRGPVSVRIRHNATGDAFVWDGRKDQLPKEGEPFPEAEKNPPTESK